MFSALNLTSYMNLLFRSRISSFSFKVLHVLQESNAMIVSNRSVVFDHVSQSSSGGVTLQLHRSSGVNFKDFFRSVSV